MNTRKFITAMLLPAAMLTACSDEEFVNGNAPSIDGKEVVEGFVMKASFDTPKVDTRAGFAGDAKYIFNNFYFEPAWKTDETAVELSDNTTLKGDMLGFCLASGTGVNVNLPFYIAGYMNTKGADGKTNIYPLADKAVNSLYDLGFVAGDDYNINDAFYSNSTPTTKTTFDALVAKVKAGTIAQDMDPTKGLFRSNTGVMTGDYIAYYPYDPTFVNPGQIPVKELPAFQSQEDVAVEANSTAANHYKHIIGNTFAYSKKTVTVAGSSKSTKSGDVVLSPLSYIAQIRLYNTSATAAAAGITLITMTTEDNAADAFALNGTIKAGSTNTFEPGAKKTGIVGVALPNNVDVGANVAKENALMAYLSIYPNNLKGKNLVVSVYNKGGQVATFVKPSQSVKEGNTDYWNIDLKDATWKAAERLVYDAESLKKELDACTNGANTLKLLADVELTNYIFDKAAADIKIIGEGKTLTLGTGNTFTNVKSLTFDCNVKVTSPLTIATKKIITINGTTTTTSEMTINGSLTAKDIVVAAGGSFIVAGTDKEDLVSVNNINVVAGILKIQDDKLTYASINNKGDLTFTNECTIAAGKTITNDGTMTLTTNNKLFSVGSITNNGKIVIPETARFEFNDGQMINAGTIENAGEMVVLKSGIFTNNGSIDDTGITYGPGFITKGANSNYTCAVASKDALVGAAKINAYTAIKVTTAITDLAESFNANGKKLILKANISFPAADGNTKYTHTLGAIEVMSNVTLTGKMTATQITILANANPTTLTIGDNSNIEVSGTITTMKGDKKRGDFKYGSTAAGTRPYVKCAGIETNGLSWSSYPEYGN